VTNSAETNSAETNSAETNSAETNSAETNSAETNSAETSSAVFEAPPEARQRSGWAYFWFTLISLAGFVAVVVLVGVTASSFLG